MKVTLAELMDAQGALQRLTVKGMAAKYAFQLARIAKAVNGELHSADRARQTAVDRYFGEKNDEGVRTVLPEHAEAWNAEIRDLLGVVLDLGLSKIGVEHMPEITMGDAMMLGWLVDDKERDEDD